MDGGRGLVALKCESPRSSAPALTATTIAMETWRHIIRCAANYIHMHAHTHTHTLSLRHIGMHRCVCVCVHTGAWHVKKSRERLKSEGKYFCFSFPPAPSSLSPSCSLCCCSNIEGCCQALPLPTPLPSHPISRCQLRCK